MKNWSQRILGWYIFVNPKTLSWIEKKQDFLNVYIVKMWRVKIEPREHPSF